MTNLQNGAIYQGYYLINQMLKADLCRESDRRENNDDYRHSNDFCHHDRQQKNWKRISLSISGMFSKRMKLLLLNMNTGYQDLKST